MIDFDIELFSQLLGFALGGMFSGFVTAFIVEIVGYGIFKIFHMMNMH